MPSLLIGAQSGGVPLVSGNPYPFESGYKVPFTSVFMRLATGVSGLAYVGYSGAITITSGGGLSSGGMNDAMEIAPGNERSLALKGGFSNVYATCVSTISGTLRLYWEGRP